MNDLRLIVLDNIEELGKGVNEKLKTINDTSDDYIVPIKRERFSNGEGKVNIEGTVRDKDIYILSDVGNYNITYKMHGFVHHLSPDEHFQDIKRVISAISGSAAKITLVTPLLYASRQHRRKKKESLDCAIALQELEELGINHIVSFDVHDPNVCNAIPTLPFDNLFATEEFLNEIADNEDIRNILVISPDMGAMERAKYFAEFLKCDVGVFYKRRDLSKIVNGKNPIVEHTYLGSDVKGKNILVVDDMIASGSSMIEVARDLKARGAKNIYFAATFALLTEGPKVFEEAYEEGLFTRLYSTNLSYVPESIKEKEWYCDVDMTEKTAKIINALNKQETIKPYTEFNEQLVKKIESKQLVKTK